MSNAIVNVFVFLRIYFSLIYLDLLFRIYGFQYLFTKYVEKYSLKIISASTTSKINVNLNLKINEILFMIDKACAFYPLEAQCLHRSFLAFRLLRRKFGIPVELVIGVRKFPFSAHAWLICNEKNVNESEEYTEQYNIILRSGT